MKWTGKWIGNHIQYALTNSLFSLGVNKILYNVSVSGKENLTNGGAIVAANHKSLVDIAFISMNMGRQVKFVATYGTQPFRWLYELTNQIDVEDIKKGDPRTRERIEKILESEKYIGFFPEGITSPDGNLGKFLGGCAYLAKETKHPIIPVYTDGNYNDIKKFPDFRSKIKIKIGKPIPHDAKESRKDLTALFKQSMQELAA